jgi:3-hydroxyacyl-[acyl-carrier-protein] dehydratase
MRWFWIDRFIEFESGRYARAVKHCSRAEDYLADHFPGWPVMPESLGLEGLAQTGGLLVFEQSGFTENPIMAKIPQARFFGEALPGDTLTYTATLQCAKCEGAKVSAVCHIGDRLFAETEILFAHFDNGSGRHGLFDRRVFLDMMRALGAFEVGRRADGSPLEVPPLHLEAVLTAGRIGTAEEEPRASRFRKLPR